MPQLTDYELFFHFLPFFSLSFKQQAKQAPFILPALSIAKVLELPTIKFEDDRAFNDLAIHLFPAQFEVPFVDLHDREEDPEMM